MLRCRLPSCWSPNTTHSGTKASRTPPRSRPRGVPVTVSRYDDQIHAFWGMVNIMDSADTAVAEVAAWIRAGVGAG